MCDAYGLFLCLFVCLCMSTCVRSCVVGWGGQDHYKLQVDFGEITRMHGSALRCVRSHSRSIWNMANLTHL